MKITTPDLDAEDRGVSPVIGVILMVAITVILAAVIGAFVLDLGSQLGSTGPQTQVSASAYNTSTIQLEHKGGDTLQTSNLKIIVDGTTVSNASTVLDTGAEFSVGETALVESGEEAGSTDVPTISGETTIKVIHEPSNSVITSTTVEL